MSIDPSLEDIFFLISSSRSQSSQNLKITRKPGLGCQHQPAFFPIRNENYTKEMKTANQFSNKKVHALRF